MGLDVGQVGDEGGWQTIGKRGVKEKNREKEEIDRYG